MVPSQKLDPAPHKLHMVSQIIEIGHKLDGDGNPAYTLFDPFELLLFLLDEVRARRFREIVFEVLELLVPVKDTPPHAPIVNRRHKSEHRKNNTDHRKDQNGGAIEQGRNPEGFYSLEPGWP